MRPLYSLTLGTAALLTGITFLSGRSAKSNPSHSNDVENTREVIVQNLPEANGFDVRLDNSRTGYTEIYISGGQFKDYQGYVKGVGK